MMYKTEIIRQTAKLLDAVNEDGNPVIETYFNDKKKRVEVWNMLTDQEKMIASVEYDEEQDENLLPPGEAEKDHGWETNFVGSLIPVLLKAIAILVEKNRDIMHCFFVFDTKKEELRVVNFEDIIILTITY